MPHPFTTAYCESATQFIQFMNELQGSELVEQQTVRRIVERNARFVADGWMLLERHRLQILEWLNNADDTSTIDECHDMVLIRDTLNALRDTFEAARLRRNAYLRTCPTTQ